ncbi:MAG TPA: energy transducer TonB [Steroidobacteraceae bacterium]|jgi:TonB family protein
MSTASALTLLAAASLAMLAPAFAFAADSCTPRVVESPTKFPLQAQLRGQKGTVYVDVTVDEQGHATRAEVRRSSGYYTLNRAATESIRHNWLFDVSDCARKDLPATYRYAVEYHNDEF